MRETLPAEIVTLNHVLYGWANDKQGIILDQADYETAAWKVDVTTSMWSSNATWTIETGKKGTLYATYLGSTNDDYIKLNIGQYGSYNNIRYYTNAELLQMDNEEYSKPIWANGGFIYGRGRHVDSNIKLFRLLEQ